MQLADKVRKAKRVYIIGNGGSYANAMHMANDLISAGVRAHVIDPATWSMLSNDYGWQGALSLWVSTMGEHGDLLIALSGSGKSANVLAAIATAELRGMEVYFLTDYLRTMDMQESEESQIRIGHDLMRELKCSS